MYSSSGRNSRMIGEHPFVKGVPRFIKRNQRAVETAYKYSSQIINSLSKKKLMLR